MRDEDKVHKNKEEDGGIHKALLHKARQHKVENMRRGGDETETRLLILSTALQNIMKQALNPTADEIVYIT